MRGRVLAVLTVAVALVAAAVPAAPAVAATGERLVTVASGLATPLLVTAPTGDDRLFIVERAGRVLVQQPSGRRTTFLDMRSLVSTQGEGGLLGLAFSPEYDRDGRFWVSYTNTSGNTRVDRLTVSGDPDVAAPGSRVNVLGVTQPYRNHNGGMIAFARDGMLLVGLGDGGGAGDPDENGQDTSTLLGSILRLDVKDRAGGGYAIPPDNPFVGRAGRDEIWAYGVRNPYRFSVDRRTGEVWVGDVGQSSREEVDRLAYPGDGRGHDLGWDCWEGTLAFESTGCPSRSGVTFPVHEYGHSGGACSITGGYVVRSSLAPTMDGEYLFGDFCTGVVQAYDPATDRVRTLFQVDNVFSFGEDGRGHVYVLDGSTVRRIVGPSGRFVDVPADSIFLRDIIRLADADVTRGCNPPTNDRFCPTREVTREQMAAFIARAAALPRRAESFRDVADGSTFARDIGAIAAEGITRGCNPPRNDLFCPDRVVTRAQMAAFLARVLELPPRAEPFVDVAATDRFARDIGAIAAEGITLGCNPPANDRFCPDRPVTRQQMAALLVRAFDL